MKKLLLLPVILLLIGFVKGQYVNIPDSSLRYWLQQNYPSCMQGYMLDTTCADVLSAVLLYPQVDSDMNGLQYFTSATFMSISDLNGGTPFTRLIGTYPPNLNYLELSNSTMEFIPANIPASVTYLYLDGLSLTSIPPLPNAIQHLDIGWNYRNGRAPVLSSGWPISLNDLIVSIDNFENQTFPPLPDSLLIFSAHSSVFTTLPAFPTSLQQLDIGRENVNFTDPSFTWPPNLTYLDCDYNTFVGDSLPVLPVNLQTLYAYSCQLNRCPLFPPTLQDIEVCSNNISSFVSFPAGLNTLLCYSNPASTLPPLPSSLTYLYCGSSLNFTTLPSLPDSLTSLYCSDTHITSLPGLPASLNTLVIAGDSLLTSLPSALPGPITDLEIENDIMVNCLAPLPLSLRTFNYANTGLSCLPNYPAITYAATPALNTMPLCTVNSGCQPFWNISGSIFLNTTGGCTNQAGEALLQPVKMNLLQSGNLIQQMYAPGVYSFKTNFNSYTVEIDTGAPFKFDCPADSTLTISASDSQQVVDFEVHCKDGFDLGVNYVADTSVFSPGLITIVKISAGDVIKNYYGVNCNTIGLSGQVQLSFTGPVTYVGVGGGVPAPTSVNGNTITWAIADFSQGNGRYDILLQTDTAANASDVVCVDVNITPTNGDNNLSNNNVNQCFAVHNSFDPNYKEVSPVSELPYPYSDWLTYTVHFQNTGTAAAHNISITDTLDANIDPTSFQLLAYSYEPTVQITGQYVTFYFNQILLPDSAANPQGSTGYVQYRVKPLANLGIGTTISNTAYIYFDYNAPVVTNSTTNTVTATAGIKNVTAAPSISIYPNPSASSWQLAVSSELVGSALEVFDAEGRLVFQSKISLLKSKIELDLASGVYWLRISNERVSVVRKLVKM